LAAARFDAHLGSGAGAARCPGLGQCLTAAEDPALDGGDLRIVGWLAGRDGPGHHGDHAEQPGHGVELVFPVRPGREAFFDAAQDAGVPADAERFRPAQQAWHPGASVCLPSLAPAPDLGDQGADVPVVLARVSLRDHDAAVAVEQSWQRAVERPQRDPRLPVPRGGEQPPSGEGSLADLLAAERPEQGLGVRSLATAPQFLGGQPECELQVLAPGSAGLIRIEGSAKADLITMAGDGGELLPRR
jgi:hypothetical protein